MKWRASMYLDSEGRYSALARDLSQHPGWVVGVLWDPVFAGMEVPRGLRFEHFAATWGSLPDVKVVPLDANQVHTYSILFKGKMDILVFPYGSIFPMDALGFYSAQAFQHFMRRGGAVLTTGGIPFMTQAGPNGERIPANTPEEMTTVFDKWVSKFGIKYYECAQPPSRHMVNTTLLPGLPALLALAPNRYGVVVNNSAHAPVPKPPHGNVFPERYPARQVIPLITATDRFGQPIATSAVFAQDFEDGSRRIHFTYEAEPHPLSPDSSYFRDLMHDLFALLTNKIIVAEVAAEFACYRAGEPVRLRAEIASFEAEDQMITLVWEIIGQGTTAFRQTEQVVARAGETTLSATTWAPERFDADEHLIRLTLWRAGRAVSMAENGFVVWDEQVTRNGPAIGLRNHYFTVNGKGTYITGTNYYESTRGEIMWFRPDVASIIRDYQGMHASGVNLIRPHYHHLKWFKDYLLFHHDRLFPFFRELADLDDPLPDERVWRIWDLFIYLSQKYGVIYGGDLFTLVPAEMGDPRGWFGTVEVVYDLERRPMQKAFLRALEERYRNVPGITWDLFNEPFIPEEKTASWAADLRTVFMEMESRRLITVGGPMDIGPIVDYGSPHGKTSEHFNNTFGKPILLQELHIDRPEPLAAEMQQAEDLRRQAVLSLRNGIAGFCPWSWTRQMRLWQDNYEHHHTFPMEKWDDRLGVNTHDDKTLKVAGQVFKDIATLLRGIDFVAYDPESRAVYTTRGQIIARIGSDPNQQGESILHVKGERCLAAMARGQIVWDDRPLIAGPADAYLFFYTDSDAGFLAARELFVKVEEPGEIWVHREGTAMVTLVECTPSGVRELEAVTSRSTGDGLVIAVDSEMTRYWVRLQFLGPA